ncbi:MAG: prepilin-type N-terminal cleavage/methylation domain-containing protein [Desulfobacteraceae bacterium]|nr:prepilin-type N-terminal cleavage/methylation domain-containing protein [Desulfobacteraceae bacterium]
MNTKRIISIQKGFTLVEMAVVLVVVGIIISTLATVLPSLIQSSKIKQSQALLERADYALQGYSLANHRLPFADSGADGIEDSGTFAGNLPYLTLGLSSGNDIWGAPIKYAVYGVSGASSNLTESFADASAFCTAIASASVAGFDINIAHTTTASPCSGAGASDSSNQAFVLASSGLYDLDGSNGRFDDCNGQSGAGFNIPGKIQSTTYDDLVRAYSLNELNQKNCSGSSSSSSSTEICDDSGENDEDADGLSNCDDPDCSSHASCSSGSFSITTTSIPSATVNSSYVTTFSASGGTTSYLWSLTGNGGFSDLGLNSSTGTLSGTLDQCPGNYTVSIQAEDSTPSGDGGPLTDSASFTLEVTGALSTSRTSGSGTSITWSSPSQEETFSVSGNYLGSINWTLNAGGATGFQVYSTGDTTSAIRKSGSSTAGTYTFTLTATDSSCSTNTDDIELDVTVTTAGASAPGGISRIEDTFEFDTNNCSEPDIIHISGDVYAVAYTGNNNNGYIKTVQITSDGQIANSTTDSFIFATEKILDIKIINVADSIYAIAYNYNNSTGRITTARIDSDGQIDNSLIDRLEFFDGKCRNPDLIQISSDIFAVAYTNVAQGNDGFVETVQIDSSGQITDSMIDTLEFDTNRGEEPKLIHIDGDVYAIAHRGRSSDGFVATISITDTGLISSSRIDRLEFDTSRCNYPDIINISGEYYAVAYMGNGDDGFVKTIEIAADGDITNSTVDSLEFDTNNGERPVILTAAGNTFIIAYEGENKKGTAITVQIDETGQIGSSFLDSIIYNSRQAIESSMVQVTSGMYAIAYSGPNNDGHITTISLE